MNPTTNLDRRTLLKNLSRSALAAGILHSLPALAELDPAPAGKNNTLQLGIIGPGSRGQELMRQLLRVPSTRFVAMADIYPPRVEQVRQLTGYNVDHTSDYRELLARKDLDAILIATPPAHHGEHVTAALRSGRPVYGEKAMGLSVADNQAILRTQKETGQLFQIGHQYRYAPWVADSVARIRRGEIGDVTHIYGYWHRNNDWRRPVPTPDPGGQLEHLLNWRLYRETSGGLVTELGSHHIDIANWVFGEQPESVLGTTSIVRYRDGRTEGDNVQATFKYTNGRRLVFSAITDNAKTGNELWIYGTAGSVQITIEDANFFYEPKAPKPSPVSRGELERGVTTGASYRAGNEMPYRGPGAPVKVAVHEEPTLTALRSFTDRVRNRRQPLADAQVGFGSGVAIAIAKDAVFTEQLTPIPKPAA